MKRPCAIIFPLVLLCLWIAGCTPASTREALARADSIMAAAPDSALAILDALDPATINSDGKRARYALLRAQALDKNYIDVADDSLISIASDYYATSSDARSRMLSLYYHGRVHYNAADYPHALVMFTRSLDEARALDDPFWCGRNADQISSVYSMTRHSSEEVHYAEIARDYFEKSKRQPFLNYVILTCARANLNNDRDSLAQLYAMQTMDSALKYNDRVLFLEAGIILGKAFYYQGKYREAIDAIEKSLPCGDGAADQSAIEHLGLSYLATGQLERASLLMKNLPDSVLDGMISFKYEYFKKKGDTRNALEKLERLTRDNNDSLAASLNQNLSQILSEHITYENKIHKLQLRANRTIRAIIIAACILAIGLIMGWSSIRYRKQQALIERNMSVAQNLQEILQMKEEKIRNLMSARYKEINSLCKTYYENKKTKALKNLISDEVSALIEDMSSNEKCFSQLAEIADENHEGVYSNFRNDFPDLKEADYKLFLYNLFGFSITAIALFLNEDKVEAVYNRKARLKRKVKQEPCERTKIYLRLLA